MHIAHTVCSVHILDAPLQVVMDGIFSVLFFVFFSFCVCHCEGEKRKKKSESKNEWGTQVYRKEESKHKIKKEV